MGMGLNCCQTDASGNVNGVNIGPDMSTCSADGTATDANPVPETADDSGVGGGGFDCDALSRQFPGCETCVYQCGDDAPACYESIIAGMCSPTCFVGGAQACASGQTG